jgi:WD40 repeat protein
LLTIRTLQAQSPSLADFIFHSASCASNEQEFAGSTSEVFSVAFSPDGKYALAGSWDKKSVLNLPNRF